MNVTASVVLYKNDRAVLSRLIKSISSSLIKTNLFIVDNSPEDSLSDMFQQDWITYIHNPSNPGFGAAHNLAIKKALAVNSNYHFIINPDVYFNNDVIGCMVNYMHNHPGVGMLMPAVLNPDGSNQYLPKLLPNPYSILLRKLKSPKKIYRKFIDKYELRFVAPSKIYKAPILSGCFTLLNMLTIKEIGSYDDRFFMYFEDWDLSRRVAEKYDTVYFPVVNVYHEYESGANKSFKLFKIFVSSALHYFNKWGWFFDNKRKQLNTQTLAQFK